MPDVNSSREKARNALFSGWIDLDGMDDVIGLYRDLFDLWEKTRVRTGAARELTDEEIRMRLNEGFTLADPEELLLQEDELAAAAADVVGVLERRSEDAGALRRDLRGLTDIPEELSDLAGTFLADGEEALRERLLSGDGMNPEAATFVLFNALKGSFLAVGERYREVDMSGWEREYCPVCGGQAAVFYMIGEGGRRYLICFRCETSWRYKRLTCPYCGKEDPEYSGYLYSEDPHYRSISASVCSGCRSYIKGWRVEGEELDDLCPQVEDLKTPAFDRAVEEEGYNRGAPNVCGIWIGSVAEEGTVTE